MEEIAKGKYENYADDLEKATGNATIPKETLPDVWKTTKLQ